METVELLFEGVRLAFGFLILLFLSGFNFSLIFFPRSAELSITDRLVYSALMSVSSLIAFVLFMDIVFDVDTMIRNVSLIICFFAEIVLLFWWYERWHLNSPLKDGGGPHLAADGDQKYRTRELNAAKDRFREDTRTRVVYHEHQQSGPNHIDHSYLMDVGGDIDIQKVMENKVKVTDSVIFPPPYPKTRYFELVLREYHADGSSLVDDLQIYPVFVTKNHKGTSTGSGTPQITERIHTKTSTAEIQWIYSQDFHIFDIIHTEDTLNQMVDRIMGKLDTIAISLKNGVHVSSHAEDRQILRLSLIHISEPTRRTPISYA